MSQVQNMYAKLGKVTDLLPPFKAVVTFCHNDKMERALMKAGNLFIDGRFVSGDPSIYKYVDVGDKLKFDCQETSEREETCGWLITYAWKDYILDTGPVTYISGIVNANGRVTEVTPRHGVITYSDADKRGHKVLFQGSKYFYNEKRLNAKQRLDLVLSVGESVQFDALPCESQENDSNCSWFATVAWRGKKPARSYEGRLVPQKLPLNNHLAIIRSVALNPTSIFVRGVGRIMSILGDEFGVALGPVKKNHWQTILFHRTTCFLFKMNMGTMKLTEVFKEGDRVRFIAAAAPDGFPTKWVASQIAIYDGKDDFVPGNM